MQYRENSSGQIASLHRKWISPSLDQWWPQSTKLHMPPGRLHMSHTRLGYWQLRNLNFPHLTSPNGLKVTLNDDNLRIIYEQYEWWAEYLNSLRISICWSFCFYWALDWRSYYYKKKINSKSFKWYLYILMRYYVKIYDENPHRKGKALLTRDLLLRH